jgi:hypothetical protein
VAERGYPHVKPYSLDEHWELLKLRYEERGEPVPAYWTRFYRAVIRVLIWGRQW